MDAKTQTWMMTPEGIKAIWDRIDGFSKELTFLTNWLAQTSVDMERLSTEPPRTTVEPTTTVPTTASPSAVAAESTTQTIPASSQSDPPTTTTRPVLVGCKCAAPWIRPSWGRRQTGEIEIWKLGCDNAGCGASLSFDETHVPAVVPTSTTSASQPSRPSASDLSKASDPSWSRRPNEVWKP